MSSSQTKIPKHILKLSTEEKEQFLNSFDNIFSDLDGVIWNLYDAIKDTEVGFKLLKNAGKKITYISNNSGRSMDASLKKFENLKMDVKEDNIYHPARNVVQYLKNINFQGLIYVIGSDFFKATLRSAGFQIVDSIPEFYDTTANFVKKVIPKDPVRAVVIDFDLNMSSFKLTKAQLYLKDPECLFIGGATDLFLAVATDTMILGPGQFLKILAESTNRKPIIMGKPGAGLAELLKKEFKITDTKRALMIGDTLEQDIGLGSVCGFQTLAVLSGSCKLQQLFDEKNSNYIPDYYADSMADFIEFFKEIK